jgi:hypothetical protein
MQDNKPHTSIPDVPFEELKQFYYETCEDWHLWDEQEQGEYPVKRMLDALHAFVKSKSNGTIQ